MCPACGSLAASYSNRAGSSPVGSFGNSGVSGVQVMSAEFRGGSRSWTVVSFKELSRSLIT